MKIFFIFLLSCLNIVNTFSLPEINIKNSLYDLLVKNNLKEFLKGFFGIKED